MTTIDIVSCTESLSCSKALLYTLENLEVSVNIKNHKQPDSDRLSKYTDVVIYLIDKPEQLEDIQAADIGCSKINTSTIKLCLFTQVPDTFPDSFYMKFHDFLIWPCSASEISTRIKFHQVTQRKRDLPSVDRDLMEKFAALNLVGQSPAFLKVIRLTYKVAACLVPVLIQGETGTGKENIARSIHYLGKRREKAFIPVNCGAIPDELFDSELFGHEKGAFTDAKTSQDGLVEIADGGTIFLDEIDSLSAKAQTSLLRFLQTQEYRRIGGKNIRYANVRIIAATNTDLRQKIKENLFREDLFFRINVLNIPLPPLRQHPEDIPIIAAQLLQKFSLQYNTLPKKLTHNTLCWLCQQPWPGNVRELENSLLRELLLTDSPVIDTQSTQNNDSRETQTSSSNDTPLSFQHAKAMAIEHFERNYLQEVLTIADGNVSEAARISGKERRALGKLLKKYDIHKKHFQISNTL